MEVNGMLLTILGISAGVLILTGWVEQIYKGYKTKSMKDISKFLMIFISAGAILWLIYGLIILDVFIIGTNIAAIILMLIVLLMKRRYDEMLQRKQ
ncbi:MAG: SemiSWEET family transporter [Nitrosopumilus sp.]|nr:SemiSWEET family transporter [Nitrosopumilus sp.]MDH3515403.1 SemiSWEET family transporter [Nitrosopumilus sp.]MDH3564296.1 SemiSWEET family transporter [Nitrosopumilus sp.]MDH5418116.1 SemiSWEET family transporter [Nitrosopumilus sp.]MDH5555034.1 SemiSWEET family transporter [Nitrosopumilus sp.]